MKLWKSDHKKGHRSSFVSHKNESFFYILLLHQFPAVKKVLAPLEIKEIAEQLNLSEGTVRSWKNRYQWDKKDNVALQSKPKKNCNATKPPLFCSSSFIFRINFKICKSQKRIIFLHSSTSSISCCKKSSVVRM